MRYLLSLVLNLVIFFTVPLYANNQLKTLEQQLSDSVITTKITAKFTKVQGLNPLKIRVSTKNGVVSLRGYVKNKEAYVHALRLAKQTKGVKTVEAEELVIKQVNTAFIDAYITAKVEAAVLTAKVFDDESIPIVGINATTSNGTVTLAGKLKQQKSILAIIKRVTAVRGVKKIISNLQVA